MMVAFDGRVRAGDFTLDAQFRARAGELVAVVGPNGAGKTTLLSAIAGLAPLDAGTLTLADRIVDAPERRIFVPPERRSVGVVFQDFRLLPALTVLDNVAFGLRTRGASRRSARERAAGRLAQFGITHLAARKPSALSGGEAQRVALARAFAADPDTLILDEPLAAVDIADRAGLRNAISAAETTRVLVTHDPIEAMALGDRVVVLEHGAVVQQGSPNEIRARPATAYAATFVGTNLIRGTARAGVITTSDGVELVTAVGDAAGPALAVIHPRAIGLFDSPPTGTPRNAFPVTVRALEQADDRVRVELHGPISLVAEVTPAAVADLGIRPGRALLALLKATEVDVVPGGSA